MDVSRGVEQIRHVEQLLRREQPRGECRGAVLQREGDLQTTQEALVARAEWAGCASVW